MKQTFAHRQKMQMPYEDQLQRQVAVEKCVNSASRVTSEYDSFLLIELPRCLNSATSQPLQR